MDLGVHKGKSSQVRAEDDVGVEAADGVGHQQRTGNGFRREHPDAVRRRVARLQKGRDADANKGVAEAAEDVEIVEHGARAQDPWCVVQGACKYLLVCS